MTPERWQCIRPILESALELDSADRPAFLDRACVDPSLRQEVEALIAAHGRAGTNAWASPAVPSFIAEEELRFRLPPGKHMGPYEILEEIAQGGMGAVYRAIRADGQYKQQVALKIVRADLGSEPAAARFRNERQVLASLDHPNIAKILDGGATADGLPYFVMELIDGLPVTEYCDRHKLPIEARLKIFRTVCSAVHYAHQHLVIHRDIKPTNILVASDGVPKLLDFGIAKILDPNLLPENATVTAGLWMMTPEYASLEQLRGEAITTATDVYSLGLVLYELLTGHHAYRFASRMPHEVARAVLETDPEKPSTAIRREEAAGEEQPGRAPLTSEAVANLRGDSAQRLQLRLAGDLDNIALKAIRKEPRERYNSVDQLAEDIRRHLEGLPVLARKSTLAYRARKYVIRHKVGVTAAALVFLSLLTGIALTIREARIARANELRAERRLQQTQELTDSLIEELPAAIGNGATPTKALMSQKAIQYLQQITQEESQDPKLMLRLARAYLRLGEVQGEPGLGNLGDIGGALDNYRHAIILLEKQLAADPSNAAIRSSLVNAYSSEGLALGWSNVQTGLEMHLKALAVLPVDNGPLDFWFEIERIEQNELVGEQYGDPYFPNLGDTAHALKYVQEAIVLANRLSRKTNPETAATMEVHYELYYSNIQMAGILWAQGHTKEALQYQSRGEAFLNSWSASGSPNGIILSSLDGIILSSLVQNSQHVREERAMAMIRRANLLAEDGRVKDAQAALRDSRGMLESLFGTDPMNAGLRRDLTRNYNLTANLLARTRNLRAALEMYRKALPLSAEALKVQPNHPDVRQHLADTYEGIGNALAAMGKNSEAFANTRKAVDLRESLAKLDPNNARYRFALAKNYISLGTVLANAGRSAEAISNYRLAIGIEKSLAAGDPFNALVARDLIDTEHKLHTLVAALRSE